MGSRSSPGFENSLSGTPSLRQIRQSYIDKRTEFMYMLPLFLFRESGFRLRGFKGRESVLPGLTNGFAIASGFAILLRLRSGRRRKGAATERKSMQDVAQLVEHLTVDQVVVGSNPIILPSALPGP